MRAARSEDQHISVLLVHQAIDDLVNTFTGEWDMKKALLSMAEMFNTPGNRFSKEYCTIAEREGVVVGEIMAYPADKMSLLNEGVINILRKNFRGTPDELSVLESQIRNSREAFDGEYYIDNLAVMPAFRGQGVGKALIKHAEAIGKEAGYDKISLLAEENNEAAYKIYEKLGYVHDCDLQVLGHTYKHLVKMV